MDRRRFLGAAGIALAGGSPLPRLLAASLRRPDVYVERWSWAMGQSVSLKLFASSEQEGLDAAQGAFAELRRIEARLSRFDPASDLSALNAHAGGKPLLVGKELRAVLRMGEGIRRASGGAFDPAIEPIMRAWGFHAARATPPSPDELAEARDAVRGARLRWLGEKVTLEGAGAALDLGGIGVGYGLDQAGRALRASGIQAALLNLSGDLLAIGAPPGASGWEVAIADPSDPSGPPVRTVRLRDQALATSANTVAVLRWREMVAGHVMDPRTARPAERVRQVSVVAPSGVMADAWSTAALVAKVALPAGCESHVVT